jgi:hypothetical protein
MKKPRSDASPLDQHREELDEWIYVENLSYKDVQKRLIDLGTTVSASSIHRWKQRRDQERLLERITERSRQASEVAERFTAENPRMGQVLGPLIEQVTFELMSEEKPDPTAVMMIVGQALRLRDQELKADDLKLKRDRFEFSAAEACLKHLPELRAIATTQGLSEQSKIDAIRRRLFGELPTEISTAAPDTAPPSEPAPTASDSESESGAAPSSPEPEPQPEVQA